MIFSVLYFSICSLFFFFLGLFYDSILNVLSPYCLYLFVSFFSNCLQVYNIYLYSQLPSNDIIHTIRCVRTLQQYSNFFFPSFLLLSYILFLACDKFIIHGFFFFHLDHYLLEQFFKKTIYFIFTFICFISSTLQCFV